MPSPNTRTLRVLAAAGLHSHQQTFIHATALLNAVLPASPAFKRCGRSIAGTRLQRRKHRRPL